MSLGKYLPTLQNTVFGWIVTGAVQSTGRSHCNFVKTNDNLELKNQLEMFWKLEEVSSTIPMSKDDMECEKIFMETTTRESDGRFVVNLPLKYPISYLGESKTKAIRRFNFLERKLDKNADHKQRYSEFIHEYVELGHASLVIDNEKDKISFYLPHHGIFRDDHDSTKTRVVFDASSTSDTGWSLNNLQYVGPTIQDDLISILFRFRKHEFVVSADIEKMFRQVNLNPNQHCLQKILWRDKSSDELSEYQLRTVTYGTTAAPYLVIRCLIQLAIDNSEKYPQASDIIKHNFYVDDMLTGFDSETEAIETCKIVNSILKQGCFNLRKWISNNPKIIEPLRNPDQIASIRDVGQKDTNKVLGLQWCSKRDILTYKIENYLFEGSITKRKLLSEISQIFDPLGLVSPCIIFPKLIMQTLWTLQISWDESIPEDLKQKWLKYRKELNLLNELLIPRHAICKNSLSIEIHGFSDASLNAYGAALYLRSCDKDGNIHVNLLTAKSRVAPLKTTTIPKLELCAALLLARLLENALRSLSIDCKIHLWSDSQIVLCWLKLEPNLLQVFVSHRVAEIQKLTEINNWHYIKSEDNPADVLSRGIYPSDLKNHHLWWSGPQWLSTVESNWPVNDLRFTNTLPEMKKQVTSFVLTNFDWFPIERFSKLNTAKRVMTYVLRFITNCKLQTVDRKKHHLTAIELEYAMTELVKISQKKYYSLEMNILKAEKPVSKGKLTQLAPFIDSENLLRVGGRLTLSSFEFDKKFPLILSAKDHLAKLIIQNEHELLLHAGPTQLLASVRDKYWIPAGRNLCKKIVHECVRCFRCKPVNLCPEMGKLPAYRVTQMFPFQVSGVDYAGPFLVKDQKGRGVKTYKVYVALFICFATRAIHIEPVTNLTTEAFLDVLNRFISRRGKPNCIYSDNGSNFVGAKRELEQLSKFLKDNENIITQSICNKAIEWHFIPPNSPHFGGIWEAGVKSCKHHLKGVLFNTTVTLEKFITILTQIEGVLNSRPLCPLNDDPHSLEILTPSHFLIGRSLSTFPNPNLTEIPKNRLSNYQHVQQIVQHYWQRWSKEYISALQERHKWHSTQNNLEPETLVVIKEDNSPVLNWQIGRVTEVYTGLDGVVRVATVKTASGSYRRSVHKLCPLPNTKD